MISIIHSQKKNVHKKKYTAKYTGGQTLFATIYDALLYNSNGPGTDSQNEE
jgi:hypothetical protein